MKFSEIGKFKRVTCPDCRGTGKDSEGKECWACDGKGVLYEYTEGPRVIEVFKALGRGLRGLIGVGE